MYDKIAKSDVARKLLGKEIEIIKPKIIVCCGTYNTVKETIKNKKIKNEIANHAHTAPLARSFSTTVTEK